MTQMDFLAALPAALGVGAYVAFHISRSRNSASPILAAIVGIIKKKGGALPELDERLSAAQVYRLIAKKPELRRSLEPKDYALLESIMKRDERAHLFAIVAMIISLLASLGAYAYLQSRHPAVVSASIASSESGGANTVDDLTVSWTHSGENGPFTVSAVDAGNAAMRVTKQVMLSDHALRLDAAELRPLWPHPVPGTPRSLRLEFSGEDGSKTFGPFDVAVAIELTYFLDGREVTVAVTDGQGQLVQHPLEAKCLAWPMSATDGTADPQTLSFASPTGKATASFADDFIPDPSTLKCVYLGTHPTGLVRYRNLHAD